MDHPLFSIVTPNFNSGEKLIRTVESLDRQAVAYEHLVMDGQSTDGSLELSASLAASRPRMHIHSEPDKGPYDGMNKGIRVATGRYLYFIGAGDTLLPGVLKEVERRLPADDLGFVYGDVIYKASRYDGAFDRLKLSRQNICHQSIFYGGEVFRLCGEYSLLYPCAADWEMNLRCFANRSIAKDYIDLVVANFEEGGISQFGDEHFDRDHLRLVRQYLGLRCYWHKKWPGVKLRLRRKTRMFAKRLLPGCR